MDDAVFRLFGSLFQCLPDCGGLGITGLWEAIVGIQCIHFFLQESVLLLPRERGNVIIAEKYNPYPARQGIGLSPACLADGPFPRATGHLTGTARHPAAD